MPRTTAAKKRRGRTTAARRDHGTAPPSDLSESEQDLYAHLQDGYELETDSLGGNPLLRKRKDQEVVRPLSATSNTVKALEQRGLIIQGKSSDPLRIVWVLSGGRSRNGARPKSAKKSRRARSIRR